MALYSEGLIIGTLCASEIFFIFYFFILRGGGGGSGGRIFEGAYYRNFTVVYRSFHLNHPSLDSGQILAPRSLSRMKLSAVSMVVKSGNCSGTVTSPSSLSREVSMTTRGAHSSGKLTLTAAANLSPMELTLLERMVVPESVTLAGSNSGT